jgi:Ca-activated chloride channel family protein
MSRRSISVFTTAGFWLCCTASWAQQQQQPNSGTIQGTVTDPSTAVIVGASVTLDAAGKGQVRNTQTDLQGHYKFEGLGAGVYKIQIESPGFRTDVREWKLSTGQKITHDVVLQVGSVAETVEVTSSVPQVQSSMSAEIARRKSRLGRRSLTVAPVPPNAEDYGRPKETGFAAVRSKPLSTFSIDVDTASYSNLRRFVLQQGQLPPKEAIRIEEMLNSFDYDYPVPEGKHPFTVTSEVAECPWNQGHRIVHIGLKSKPIASKDLPPANLTFLLDVSGSMMSENKLPLIKKSFRLLVDQLRDQDRVSMVVYAGAAGVVLHPTPGSRKDRILEAIDRLQAGGSTAGAEGIRLAYAMARQNYRKDGNNRVILATDGDFNVGVSSDDELVRLIESERDHGIFLSVLGYGYGNLKDAKLEGLARNGNGNYAYIDNLLEARRVLVEQMGATLLTVAKDVKLQVEFNPAKVKAYRLIGYENRRLNDEDFKDDAKDAGEMGAGHSVTALYEVIPAGSKEEVAAQPDALRYQEHQVRGDGSKPGEMMTVSLRYKPPTGRKSIQLEHIVEDRNAATPSPNLRLALAVTELGLLLSDSKFKKDASFASAIANARAAVGHDDPGGRRFELVYLAQTAARLTNIRAERK